MREVKMERFGDRIKSLIKEYFPQLVSIYRLFWRLFSRKEPQELWPTLLNQLNRTTSDIFFVEIGAMDGISFDPLYKHVIMNGWHGLLVEPLPDLFEQLREAYCSQEGLIFENVAIADVQGNKKIYRVSPEAVEEGVVPDWAKGIASFFNDRNALGGKRISKEDFEKIRPHIISQTVTCETLNTLLRKHNIRKIDIFQMDVEGYDFNVLKQLNFYRFRPYIIRMEWWNLPDEEKQFSLELLKTQGYRTSILSVDLVAWRKMGILARIINKGQKRLLTAYKARAVQT
jgi:FkbM family methyltransferase